MKTTQDASDEPLLGVVLDGRYRLGNRIARGGMATVFAATDERLDRPVAVKVMHRAFAEDPTFVARFTREARSAARLSAPEVVAVYDQGNDLQQGVVYLVMEHVRGRDLRALLNDRGALPPARALSLLEPVLAALAAAHAAGIVHRDVKPENVLLGDDGRVKVADFGLARAVEESSVTATIGVILGTVDYLAPEQIERGEADARTDVYAAGTVLWELLVGRPPHHADTSVKVLYRHVNHDVPAPSSVVDGISPALDDLVVRATRRNPDLRPADAAAFLAEVRALRRELPVQETRNDTAVVPGQSVRPVPAGRAPTTPEPGAAPPLPPRAAPGRGRSRRPGRGRRVLLALLAVLLIGGGGAGAWWVTNGRYTEAPGLVGLDEATAVNTLSSRGFTPRTDPERAFSDTVPVGKVVSQDPDRNGKLLRHGTVTLTLSRGPDLRAVPTVIGGTQDKAAAALAAVGLAVGPVTSEFSDRAVGTVLRSDPGAGQLLRPDAAVALVLSKGIEQLPVPSVVNRSTDDAVSQVRAARFVEVVNEVYDEQVPAGQVMAQNPASGSVGKGSTITLTVSKGPEPRTVPGGIIGHDADTGRRTLEALGLKVRIISIPGPGTVRSMDPDPGKKVARGSTVTLYVF